MGIMNTFNSGAVEKAREILSKAENAGYLLLHTESVVRIARMLCESFPQVDKELVEIAAWWHDTGRVNTSDHEWLSAHMASNYFLDQNIGRGKAEKIFYAIVRHKWSMRPETLEGHIIRDADKLDYVNYERWQYCLDNNEFSLLGKWAELIPLLRDEILYLDASKKLYDAMISDFVQFVKSVQISWFRETRQLILESLPLAYSFYN